MGFYRTCPACGANLDPGERCDCEACLLPETGLEEPQDDLEPAKEAV